MATKIAKNFVFPGSTDTYQVNAVALGGKAASTYATEVAGSIKGLSVSGKVITYTKNDGTTGTITTQDTNTTYSNFVKSGSGAKAGLVPAPSTTAGTTKYLREDGTWQVPPDTNTTYTLSSFGITATAAELNKMDGVTATATELNYMDGVTSNVQTQLDGKAASGHTHTTTIATSSGTNELTLAHGTKYAITAGGDSFVFTMPADNNTDAIYSGIAYCTTAAGTAAKVGVMPKFKLASGQYILLRTTADNSATSSVTLNVNSTGAKPVKIGNSSTAPTASNFLAGDYLANYDGTNWVLTRIYLTDNNTTYSNMTAATSSAAGKAGLVPAPAAGKQTSFLRGDGTWVVPTDTKYTHPNSGVTAGTYKSVTVNAAGHVTAGSNPTTISGFGITDAYTKTEVDTIANGKLSTSTKYAGSSSVGGAATSAAKLATARTINGVSFDGSANITVPATFGITTGGTGAAYTATVSGITSLTAGASFVMIPNTVSTSTAPTLNVNSLGAKTIRRRVSNATTSTAAGYNASWLAANKPIRVEYDGTYWIADLPQPSAADISGTLAVGKGGTGKNTLTSGSYLVGNGTSAVTLKTVDEVKADLGLSEGVKIQQGSYSGTGATAGKTLTFEFTPKLVIIQPTGWSVNPAPAFIAQYGSEAARVHVSQYTWTDVNTAWTTNSLTLTTSYSNSQATLTFNISGKNYSFVAIG